VPRASAARTPRSTAATTARKTRGATARSSWCVNQAPPVRYCSALYGSSYRGCSVLQELLSTFCPEMAGDAETNCQMMDDVHSCAECPFGLVPR
jgi:hypothetical protein